MKEVEDPKIAAGVIWRSVRITASIRECFRAGGSFTAALGGTHPFGEEVCYLEEVSKLKKDLIKKGILRDDGGYYLTWPHEHGHLGHAEILLQFHLTPEVAEAIEGFSGKATKLTTDMHYGVPHMVAGDEAHDIFGPHTMNYHLWMRKLKKAFDPREVSDSAQYISAK